MLPIRPTRATRRRSTERGPRVARGPSGRPQGPGLVGDPGSAILVVIAIGMVAVGLTLLWLKLTGGRRT